jgi:pimeloyl-ACP methyl ester carboxylesterase
MEPTTTEVSVLGRKIHEIRGGSGKPLLYLHSAMGEAMWLPFLLKLAEGRELHVPALPGFLTSQGIDQIHDIEDLANHYLAYIDTMGWESVDVIGLSFGGWIAAELAARFPDRISKLVLVNAGGIWIKEKPITDIFRVDMNHPERVKAMLFHDVECPAAQMLPMPGNMELPDELLINMFNATAATAKIGWNPLLHNPKLEGMLWRTTAETLVLWSDKDAIVPPDYGRKYAKLIPKAKLEIVPDVGHLMPFEKEEEFLKAVTSFLN